MIPAWKRWSPILLRPEGLYGTRPAEGGNKAAKLKAIREALRSAKRVWLATDCDRGGVFFVARGEPSEVLDTVEEALDAVACPVEHGAEAGFPATMHHRRDVGRGTCGFDLAAQPIGVVSLVGEHDGVLTQMAEQARNCGERTCATGALDMRTYGV